MKSLKSIKQQLKKQMPILKKEYNISQLGIFGSFIKNKSNSKSDLDLLVNFSKTPTLFEFINLENYLARLLNIKVDLVSQKALKPHIGEKVLKEVEYI